MPSGKCLTFDYAREQESGMVQDKPSTVSKEKEKDITLFGGGFLERATKRLEDEKAIAKVTGARTGGSSSYRKRQQDPNDLRLSLEKGAPANYGGRKYQHHQPYPQQHPNRKFPGKEVEQVAQQTDTLCMLGKCFLKNFITPILCTHLPVWDSSRTVSRPGRQ